MRKYPRRNLIRIPLRFIHVMCFYVFLSPRVYAIFAVPPRFRCNHLDILWRRVRVFNVGLNDPRRDQRCAKIWTKIVSLTYRVLVRSGTIYLKTPVRILIHVCFLQLCLFAFLAFAAAAPAPAPAPAPGAIIGAPLVTSYSAPIVSAPLTYSAYSLPAAYSAYSAYPALPYAYKSYGYYV